MKHRSSKKAKAIRQGDVMLWPGKVPAHARKVPLRPLALGERTGHHHSLVAEPGVVLDDVAEMFEAQIEGGVKTYVRITGEGVSLVHQQHKPHKLEPGMEFEYIPQVENSDWGTRQVVD